MSTAELTAALLHFLRLFNHNLAAFSYPPTFPSALSDLHNSLYLYRLLHTLDAAHFDLSDVDESAIADNLQQLLVSCETYIEDTPSLATEVDLSDVVEVRESGVLKDDECLRLVEVVLLCAVGGGRREEVIELIMGMSEREQELMMQAINDIRTRLHMAPTPVDTNDKRASLGSVDGSSTVPASPAAARLNASFSFRSPTSASSSSTASPAATPKHEQLPPTSPANQQQLVTLEREMRELRRREAEQADSIHTLSTQLEQQKRQLDSTVAVKEKEYSERLQRSQTSHARDVKELEHRASEQLAAAVAKHQKQQLTVEKEKLSLASQLEAFREKEKEWQDTLQLTKAKADQAMGLEAKVARLQQQLVSVGEMRAEVEYSEEEAKGRIERIAELEREVREVAALRATVQRLKATVVKREEEALEWRLREEQLVSELDELKESVKHKSRHAKEAEEEVKRLQAELRDKESSQKERKEAVADVSGFEVIGTPTSIALRERVRRLETENEQLRLRAGGDSSNGTDVLTESELDIARSVAKANETKYVEAMRRVTQLERQLRNTAAPLMTPTEQQNEISALHTEIDSLHAQLTAAHSNNAPATTGGDTGATTTSTAADKKQKKYAELYKHSQKKVTALRAKEEELRLELDKVRKGGEERERLLRAVVAERETEVEVREKVRLEEMNIGLRERRAMSAAFYGLGMEYATAIVTGRIAPAAGSKGGDGGSVQGMGGRSWIAKQRAKVIE